MVDVPVQDMNKNTFTWHNKNGYKSSKTYNLFNYFSSIEDSHSKYLHYQMTKPLSVQDSIITQKSSPTPVRFSPRMGSNAINYARSSATNRVSITPNMSPISSSNVDQSISKISAMFPTASESHIKSLLNKYHNREAVVISALQVEKHPIATPGPYTPPSVSRHYMLQANPSPLASPLPKPAHYSPKMKLRYLKSVFPVVEETVLLDTLCSADNNVNQATKTLLTMGFNKRHNITNIVPKLPRVTLTNSENDYEEDDMFWLRRKACDNYDKTKSTCSSWPVSSVVSTPTKKINVDEQIKIKQRLQVKFDDQEEKIIIFALESTDYNELLADQILKNHLDNEFKTKDENDGKLKKENSSKETTGDCVVMNKLSHSKTESRNSFCEINVESQKAVANGTQKSLAKGPNKDLLSKMSSSKCELDEKNRVKPKGPNKSLLSKIHSLAKGPNVELKKGPSKGLAKGSIFHRLFRK
ncbi:uncharacterized protein LOC132951219 isoform X2 [Metopolophium dirhodum]|uniref:uncharacterized protein LOC132951219 isoform X2 n=1 Tax=Metopolophium dirhodum TaxID=44670 RepID=UPI00298F3E99|nr:uncharacterized protein LOC132951219 isoform X2 [Metopolophium dirhodum]